MHSFKFFLTACYLLITCSSFAQDTLKSNSSVYAKVEVEAAYPGGNTAWAKYVSKNMKSGVPSKDAPTGKYQVIALFIVGTDGDVKEVKPLTKFGYDMEEEVVRVIENSGKWTPAMQNGKPVNAYRKQPVTFIVESADFTINSAVPYTLFTKTDNEITITSKKVKPADIGINVQGGTGIQLSDGKFIVRVNKPGRVTIEIVNSKKDDKEIGAASFEVMPKE